MREFYIFLLFVLFIICISIYYVYYKKRERFDTTLCNTFSDDDMIVLLRNIAKYVRPDINCKITVSKGKKSQTISKRHIEICIRDKDNNMYPLHTLLYVLLHEMSHVISATYSGYENKTHDSVFYTNFEKLLALAKSKGIRVSEDDVPLNYCNIHL